MNRRKMLIAGGALTGVLACGTGGACYLLNSINRLTDGENEFGQINYQKRTNLIFDKFPDLVRSIPWIPIGNFPTPVKEVGSFLGIENDRLWVKQDSLSSFQYGGNKVRKLEYLLGDAKSKNCKTIVTIGGIGSNHALASCIHGKANGFNVHLCLFDQPVTAYVKKNLMGFLAANAKLHYSSTMKDAYLYAWKLFRKLKKHGNAPYFILSGGTCGLSNIGHVNAAMELAHQIRAGLMPMPDKIFIAAGTCGSIAGLLAGVKIMGLTSRIIGVRVVDSFPAYPYIIRYYAQKVIDHLRKYTSDIPNVKIRNYDLTLLTSYLGHGYGEVTEKGQRAVDRTAQVINLETTYTGKTMAACFDYIEKSNKQETILFWNTFNSATFPQATSTEGLPEEIIKKIAPPLSSLET